MNRIGDCTDEELVEELFGSVTDFARLVDEHGDNFMHGDIDVVYCEETDIHTFYWVPE